MVTDLLAKHKGVILMRRRTMEAKINPRKSRNSLNLWEYEIISVRPRSNGKIGQPNQPLTQLCYLLVQSWLSQDWVVDFGSRRLRPRRMRGMQHSRHASRLCPIRQCTDDQKMFLDLEFSDVNIAKPFLI